MDALVFSLNAVFPLLLVSALGFYVRRKNVVSDTFLKEGNRFCFRYGFMAMMFVNIYDIDSLADIRWQVVAFAVAVILVLFVIGFAVVPFAVPDDRQKGVVHQAFYRSNYATIGLPLAFNLCGSEGLIVASLVSAFSVPLYNVLGVISLSAFVRQRMVHPVRFIVKQIVTNPLIIGVAAGFVCLLLRPHLGGRRLSTGSFRFVYKALASVGGIAPWLSLIILGGQFKFSAVRRLLPQISLSVASRLVLAPVLGMAAVVFVPSALGLRPFTGAEYAALFALFAAPQAVASVSMADQMGGDSELAGQVLVWTALFSMPAIFAYTAVFRSAGLF
ncbi:AEC family transporter [Treponema brennaborense]|uniref:Auxin Efflux Carrier n=1 Tax=Treponema brennaborense (strain DSM 12168 / CIP 105900 / DD5/3) TaxID=906968 RepID=F4LLT3_TREBD|nr:AEC family transporter [Treponema brennaborense]AEE17727.1 Auxin Efflux Carrier [Treponema brennaborense DSM 12168]